MKKTAFEVKSMAAITLYKSAFWVAGLLGNLFVNAKTRTWNVADSLYKLSLL